MKADDQFLRRRHVRENNAIASEVAAARKTALSVRRAALKKQVEDDKQMHKQELQDKFGKTFYADRLWLVFLFFRILFYFHIYGVHIMDGQRTGS